MEFAGVSAQIVPETVSFVAPNVELIEQNFDYDLLRRRSSWKRPSAARCGSCA